ncbi:MAG: hypothetical protein ACKO7W_08755, partial [Elainella sp.]
MVQAQSHPNSTVGNLINLTPPELAPSELASPEPERLIQFTHPELYRTSEWYTGYGEIAASGDGRSFEVTATYRLEATVKL